MKQFFSTNILYFICFIFSSAQAQVIDYTTVFPTVVQGHVATPSKGCISGNSSTLTVTNNSK